MTEQFLDYYLRWTPRVDAFGNALSKEEIKRRINELNKILKKKK